MSKDKKLGRLHALIHKYDINANFHLKINNNLIEYLNTRIHISVDNQTLRKMKLSILGGKKIKIPKNENFAEIKKLVLDLGINIDKYIEISKYERKKRPPLKENTAKETRDNKGVYVGGGGSNCNKIRYPKKTRSKRVWKIFYEMFPHLALIDNFNGKTSKRMK